MDNKLFLADDYPFTIATTQIIGDLSHSYLSEQES